MQGVDVAKVEFKRPKCFVPLEDVYTSNCVLVIQTIFSYCRTMPVLSFEVPRFLH